MIISPPNNIITVEDLIQMLEEVKDKSLPVTLCTGYDSTDYMWLEISDNKVYLGVD